MASGVKAGTVPEVAFSRHGGIYRSDVFITSCKPGPAYRFPAGSGQGHKARRKKTRLPIVATSSLGALPRLRFTGTRNLACTLYKPRQKGTFLLCLDIIYNRR
jgi:hypothetical protein